MPRIETLEQIDHQQTKLQSRADEIIKDPKPILEKFVAMRLYNYGQITEWGRLQGTVKKLLDGKPDSDCPTSLRRTADKISESTNNQKEEILAAAMICELNNWKSMNLARDYNPRILLRAALVAKEQKGLFGITMRKYVDTIKLSQIYNVFRDQTGLSIDLPALSKIAIERSTSEPEVAKEILEATTTSLFRPSTYLISRLNADTFFRNDGSYMMSFTPEVLNYAFTRLNGLDHEVFEQVVGKIYSKLSQEDIPLNKQEFYVKFRSKNSHSMKVLEKTHDEMVFLDTLTKSSPLLAQAYREYAGKKDLLQKLYEIYFKNTEIVPLVTKGQN